VGMCNKYLINAFSLFQTMCPLEPIHKKVIDSTEKVLHILQWEIKHE